jgi:hypothetical protein
VVRLPKPFNLSPTRKRREKLCRIITRAARAVGGGDEITFKYEGNVRATVEGSEVIGGKTWLIARASLEFKVPASQVVRAERGEPGR